MRLVLVTNPNGAFLPTGQASLDREWKRDLLRLHGIRFDALSCLTNMPIGRFLEWLIDTGRGDAYLQQLASGFNPSPAQRVMCRNTLSVGWGGRLYDCDFNQMLDLGMDASAPQHVRDLDEAALQRRFIRVGRHCFGCTAGAGSSCGGATAL